MHFTPFYMHCQINPVWSKPHPVHSLYKHRKRAPQALWTAATDMPYWKENSMAMSVCRITPAKVFFYLCIILSFFGVGFEEKLCPRGFEPPTLRSAI